MRWASRIALFGLALCAARPAAAGLARCTGDCDDDKQVGIAELVTMVGVALGRSGVVACPNGDRNHNDAIEIDELVRAVGHALDGCEDDIEPLPYKHRIGHPLDPYLAYAATPGGPSWVKFTIRVAEPEVVYFQNSGAIPFHQQFVAAALEPYVGWTPAEIDAVSLHAEGQQLVFGVVLYSPSEPHEIAIQLVRQDAYSVEEVVAYFAAVRAAIDAAASVPVLYFPTFEQQASAAQQRDALAAAGIALGSTERWVHGDVCYALGWAHGRVVSVPGDQIADAYASGTLRPEDVLLTDGVPAEIPFVAGVLSLAPSTPSSHVAILAGDWQIPFAFLAQPESVAAAQALIGREVVLRATTLTPRFFGGGEIDTGRCEVRLVDVTGALDTPLRDALRDRQRAPDLDIRPMQRAGRYAAEVANATPDDIVTLGGKASNYGFLRRAIPDNSRVAIAFTFDLWNDYLDQMLDGVPLRQRIATLLAPFASYPPADVGALFEALDQVRDLIDDEADFTATQRSAIVAALDRFDPNLPIRFRSSTNVEDSEVFTGAGLYESESGCLADDLDGDGSGPSHCDATRAGERGVFRALRKVFQSFYNDNAFLERLRHRVDESTVGMAVLVHHTFTDDTEEANGVATLRVTSPTSAIATIVSQPGAFSVTNPEDDGRPEEVEVFAFGDSRIPTLRQGADRLPLGATVLQMPQEYNALTTLLVEVGHAFGAFHGESQFTIEFEYKKVTGEGLDVKQVRRIPDLTGGDVEPPILIHSPFSLCTFQGEYGDVFANYRLKTRWQPVLANRVIASGSAGFYVAAPHQYVLDGTVQELAGAPSSWAAAAHDAFDPQLPGVLGFRDAWTVGNGATRRRMTLRTLVPTAIGPKLIPILFPEDLGYTLEAQYDAAVPYLDFDGTAARRDTDSVQLLPCSDALPLGAGHLLQQRSATQEGVSIASSFYWPPAPTGSVAGYTAPLDRWVGSTISGVVAPPVTLHGYFAQTYRPEHHNFAESFLFDPHLEPGVDPAVLAAWQARGIRALLQQFDFPDAPLRVLTDDGRLVELDSLR
ncbi:MAG: PEP/pyruvate-binding domain-containing protein [Deltaproteobacteria bacterium]|nr:PEP/pyruvate-binding domain-containing protein [Deltaproteobacteria bacterium]